MSISNEAVEAAALASYVRAGGGTPESWPREECYYRREYLEDARVQLEAAAPHMLAGAEEKLSAIIVLLDPLERAASDEAAHRRAFDATLKIRAVLDAK